MARRRQSWILSQAVLCDPRLSTYSGKARESALDKARARAHPDHREPWPHLWLQPPIRGSQGDVKGNLPRGPPRANGDPHLRRRLLRSQ